MEVSIPGAPREGLRTLAALALGLALAAGTGELLARLFGPRFSTERTWEPDYHPRLGYVPRPGYRARAEAAWHVNVDADGWRSNGGPRPAGLPILALGDSYTFGEEVEDDGTWPAALERELGLPVLNAGVSAYGFDQTVLRTELLLASQHPRGVVVSIILDDVRRSRCSIFGGTPKPYFDVDEGRLVLRNVPVPRPLESRPLLGPFFRHSRLLTWIQHASHPRERYAHDRGQEVALLLIARLGALARGGVPMLFLLQGPIAPGTGSFPRFHNSTRPALRELEEAAAQAGLPTLNLVEAAWEQVRQRPARRAELYIHEVAGHMTPAGNAWVGQQVAERLRALGWAGPGGNAAQP